MASSLEESELRTELFKRDVELEDCSIEIATLTEQLRQQRENTRKITAQLEGFMKSKVDYSYNSSPELKSSNGQELFESKRPSAIEIRPVTQDWLQDFESQKAPSPTTVRSKPSEMLDQANYRYTVLQKKLGIVLKENESLKDRCKKLEQENARLKTKSPPRRSANEELLTRQVRELTAALNEKELAVNQLESRVHDLESPLVSRIIGSPLEFIAEERDDRGSSIKNSQGRYTQSRLSQDRKSQDSPSNTNIEDRIKLLEHKIGRFDSPDDRRQSPVRREPENRASHNFRLWQEVSDEIQRPLRSSRSPSLESKLHSLAKKVRSTDILLTTKGKSTENTLTTLLKQLEAKNTEVADLKVKYEGLLQKYVKHATERPPQPITLEVRSSQLSPRVSEQIITSPDRRSSLVVTPQTERRTSLLSTELARRGLLSSARGKQKAKVR